MEHKELIQLNSDVILNGISDGIIVINKEQKIIYMNRAAKLLLGGSETNGKEDFGNATCVKVVGHSACSDVSCPLFTTINTDKEVNDYEAELVRGNKKIKLNISTSFVTDGSGNVVGIAEFLKDITLQAKLKEKEEQKTMFANIIGKSVKMRGVFKLLKEVAITDSTVLLCGETGTGKELAATAIHRNSARKDGPFLKVNCAAFSEGVLESELFGHVKGSFTGAIADRVGRFEAADGGTLFLDEVGDIPPGTQVKLLRVLQDGHFERVGDTKTISTNVRLVAATNKDLKQLISEEKFRDDLYFRLKVVQIHLPPLREREEDIPFLVSHFIKKFNKAMKKELTGIAPSTMDILIEYNYPGNIRELEHTIEHAFVRCHEGTILPEHLPHELQEATVLERSMASADPLKAMERELIERALKDCDRNMNRCAAHLNISRTTLWRKMKELKIEK